MGTFDGVELTDLEIPTARLRLRPWRPGDTDRLQAIMRDRSMRTFLPSLPDPYSRDVAGAYITGHAAAGRRDGTGICCAVADPDDRVAGSIELRLGSAPDIGYWTAPDARGHGYAAEATRALVDWALEHGVHRVELEADVRNLASARTALAAGFGFEGISRDVRDREADGTLRPPTDIARFARVTGDDGPVPHAFAALPPAGLTDGVVTVRALGPDDATGLAATDDEVALRWSFDGQALTARAARRIAESAGLDWLVGATARAAIVDVATGRFAGKLNLRRNGPPGVGGVGYAVHPAFRGRGYTTRALRLLIDWAFGSGGFARLELGAKAANAASIRAAAHAGFEPDGVRAGRLRNPDGTFGDEVRFALLNPRTRATPPAGSARSRRRDGGTRRWPSR